MPAVEPPPPEVVVDEDEPVELLDVVVLEQAPAPVHVLVVVVVVVTGGAPGVGVLVLVVLFSVVVELQGAHAPLPFTEASHKPLEKHDCSFVLGALGVLSTALQEVP